MYSITLIELSWNGGTVAERYWLHDLAARTTNHDVVKEVFESALHCLPDSCVCIVAGQLLPVHLLQSTLPGRLNWPIHREAAKISLKCMFYLAATFPSHRWVMPAVSLGGHTFVSTWPVYGCT